MSAGSSSTTYVHEYASRQYPKATVTRQSPWPMLHHCNHLKSLSNRHVTRQQKPGSQEDVNCFQVSLVCLQCVCRAIYLDTSLFKFLLECFECIWPSSDIATTLCSLKAKVITLWQYWKKDWKWNPKFPKLAWPLPQHEISMAPLAGRMIRLDCQSFQSLEIDNTDHWTRGPKPCLVVVTQDCSIGYKKHRSFSLTPVL